MPPAPVAKCACGLFHRGAMVVVSLKAGLCLWGFRALTCYRQRTKKRVRGQNNYLSCPQRVLKQIAAVILI